MHHKLVPFQLELCWNTNQAEHDTDEVTDAYRYIRLIGPKCKRGEPQHVAEYAGEALTRQKYANVLAWKLGVLREEARLHDTSEPTSDNEREKYGPVAEFAS